MSARKASVQLCLAAQGMLISVSILLYGMALNFGPSPWLNWAAMCAMLAIALTPITLIALLVFLIRRLFAAKKPRQK